MTISEAIKKAEEKQKYLGENVKIYIRRRGWSNNFIDPTDFNWVNALFNLGESRYTFKKLSAKFLPNKDNMTSNDWELFTQYLDLKENKETKPEPTSISKENITNTIEQIALIKKELNFLLQAATKNREMFEKNYGINFDYYINNPKILVDNENAALYLFVELVRRVIKNTNVRLNKAIIELGKPEQHKE